MAKPLDPRTEIGHVHLKVADLERAVAFYSGVLGFEVTQRMGQSAAFLSAGGYHHHIGLNTWESQRGPAPRRERPGSITLRFDIPIARRSAMRSAGCVTRACRSKARAIMVSVEALYLRDPDGNGVELYWDRPRVEWPREADGTLKMVTERLDLDALLAEGAGTGIAAAEPSSPYALMTEAEPHAAARPARQAAAAAQGPARRCARRV